MVVPVFSQKATTAKHGCFSGFCAIIQNSRSVYRTPRVMHVRRMTEKRRRTERCGLQKLLPESLWSSVRLEILNWNTPSVKLCKQRRRRYNCIIYHNTLTLKFIRVVQSATQRDNETLHGSPSSWELSSWNIFFPHIRRLLIYESAKYAGDNKSKEVDVSVVRTCFMLHNTWKLHLRLSEYGNPSFRSSTRTHGSRSITESSREPVPCAKIHHLFRKRHRLPFELFWEHDRLCSPFLVIWGEIPCMLKEKKHQDQVQFI